MFLRFGFIVGQAGMLVTWGMLFISFLAATLTGACGGPRPRRAANSALTGRAILCLRGPFLPIR